MVRRHAPHIQMIGGGGEDGIKFVYNFFLKLAECFFELQGDLTAHAITQ